MDRRAIIPQRSGISIPLCRRFSSGRNRPSREHIENNFTEKFTVDERAGLAALGRCSFERRFKAATHNTVIEYIQRVKIEAAKRSLESERKNVSEIMYDVGYGDAKAFRDVFKKVAGLTPGAYRDKYHTQWRAI